MAEAGFLARLRARLLGDGAPDGLDVAAPGEGADEGGVIVSNDGELDITEDGEGGLSGGDPVLQGGPTVGEHPDVSHGLDADPDATSGAGVHFDLDLDLEADTPVDAPDPGPQLDLDPPLDLGPQLDLDPDALGGGLDAPTITPAFDLDPVGEPPADLDDLA